MINLSLRNNLKCYNMHEPFYILWHYYLLFQGIMFSSSLIALSHDSEKYQKLNIQLAGHVVRVSFKPHLQD